MTESWKVTATGLWKQAKILMFTPSPDPLNQSVWGGTSVLQVIPATWAEKVENH